MNKKTVVSKSVKYLMLASVLGTTAVSLVTIPKVGAATLNTELINPSGIKDDQGQDSAITYMDSDGSFKVLPVPVGTPITITGHPKEVDVKVGKDFYKLKQPKRMVIKGVTVTNLVPFYTDSIEYLMLDDVEFKNGSDFSGMDLLETFLVKDSTFGGLDYSLAIHGAPLLTMFEMDNTTLVGDLRITDNKILEKSTITNSTFNKVVTQEHNKAGYETMFYGNKFLRDGKIQRQINSGGMSDDAIFYINRKEDVAIGETKFDGSKDGELQVTYTDDSKEKIIIPKETSIEKTTEANNVITMLLSNGDVVKVENAKELIFNNTHVQKLSFLKKDLKLEVLGFVNSKTNLIDVKNNETLHTVKVIASDISVDKGYFSFYDNKAIKFIGFQDSQVHGESGYISVYNNPTLEELVINNSYVYGYVSAYHIPNAELKISNSRFDDYISTDTNVQGEGKTVSFNEEPVFNIPNILAIPPYMSLNEKELIKALGITAIDAEDGDISDKIEIIDGFEDIDFDEVDSEHTITISVTDSGGLTVTKEVTFKIQY